MAKQSVTPTQKKPQNELANDLHWIGATWKEHTIPGDISFHLARVDRCIRGATGIAKIMQRFALGEEHVAEFEGDSELNVVYPKLSPEEADRLRVGMIELLEFADDELTQIRDFPSRCESAMKGIKRD